VGLVMVAALGAVAALADTLFPAESLTGGLGADWAPAQHFLTRLRVLHPVAAVLVSGALAATAARRLQSSPAKAVLALVVIQVFAGVANVVLLTPVWMQLVHLGIADALWVAWVLLAIEAPAASSKLDDQDRVAAGFG
jgi:heme A synthase